VPGMRAKLAGHRYGKSRVRVLKVLRDGAKHTIKELNVSVILTGDFESSYTSGDNSRVVATDTIKNTVNVLAHGHLGEQTEPFAQLLAEHFPAKYPQVHMATVEITEVYWDALVADGAVQPHSFAAMHGACAWRSAITGDGRTVLRSGIRDLLIAKSTDSGFEGFARCEFTTLPETKDRILATSLDATWTWSGVPSDYNSANRRILATLLEPFALNYSPSVQTTLFQMGQKVLEDFPDVSEVHLAAPNKHCLLIDLKPFGIENRNELFVPTDEPHGQIEAIIRRE
jgi:urate oxidase